MLVAAEATAEHAVLCAFTNDILHQATPSPKNALSCFSKVQLTIENTGSKPQLRTFAFAISWPEPQVILAFCCCCLCLWRAVSLARFLFSWRIFCRRLTVTLAISIRFMPCCEIHTTTVQFSVCMYSTAHNICDSMHIVSYKYSSAAQQQQQSQDILSLRH